MPDHTDGGARLPTSHSDAATRTVELASDAVRDMLELAALAKPAPLQHARLPWAPISGIANAADYWRWAASACACRGFVKLSGICVHPTARGRGLGAAITLHLAQLAMARGETPFLRVFADTLAIALYRRLGFRARARLWVICRQFGRADQ